MTTAYRSGADRTPNARLRELLVEADWTLSALARAVNAQAVREGRFLSYDRTSVAHWLSGTVPRKPTPLYVAAALTRRIGRPVTPGDAGFPAPPPEPGEDEQDDPLTLLATLGTADEETLRRAPVRHQPLPDDLVRPPATAAMALAVPGSATRQAAAVREFTRHCAEGFDTFGGGYGLRPLTAYLVDTVLPWLRAPAADAHRAPLLRETGRLAFLLGRMHTDCLLPGAAQRFLVAALRLAAAAGDTRGWAMVMSTLSAQADELGHTAFAAQTGAAAPRASAITCAQQAFVQAQSGVAQAGQGDTDQAERSLRRAYALAGPPAAHGSPFPTYHYTAFVYRVGVARWAMQDPRAAIDAWRDGLEHCPPVHRRAVALSHSRTAQALLHVGRLTDACRHWHALLDMHHEVPARIVGRAVADARSALSPFRAHPTAAAVLRAIPGTVFWATA
jgi:hypothetical protein